MEVVWIHEDGVHPGGVRAVDVGTRGVTDMDGALGGRIECLERELEDARVGFGDADHGRVEDGPDLGGRTRPDLADAVFAHSRLGVATRVRHDRDLHAELCDVAQRIARSRNDPAPYRAGGEL